MSHRGIITSGVGVGAEIVALMSERARERFYALAMLKSDFGKLTAAMAPWNCKLTSIPSR